MAAIPTGTVNHLTLSGDEPGTLTRVLYQYFGLPVPHGVRPEVPVQQWQCDLAMNLSPDPARAITDDQFDENRVGLHHVSFNVASHEILVQASQILDECGVPRGEIKDLADLGLYVLAFRDPDNIQLELTAPH